MSATAAGADARVTMDRWLNRYRVAGSPGRPGVIHEVMQRIDRCVAQELPATCEQRLGHWFDAANPAVWRIRELHLSFTVDASAAGAADIASAWGDRLAAGIGEIIGRGEESDGVLRFPTRAAYLAQFALDLTAGRAANKWYYDEFRSLAMLPAGTALAEALTRQPGAGARTIVHLAKLGRLDEILEAMTESNAEAVYRQCFTGEGRDSPAQPRAHSAQALALWSGRLLEVWNDAPIRFAGAAQRSYRDALRLLASVALRHSSLPGNPESDPAACAAVDGLIDLRRVLASMPSAVAADRLVRDLVEGRSTLEESVAAASRLGVISPGTALRFLFTTAQGDGDWAAQAAAVLSRDRMPPALAVLAADSMITGFAGMFLLGPALVSLNPIVEMAAGEGKRQEEIAGFLRYMILAKCLGSTRMLEAMGDPALRLLSGCSRARLEDGFEASPSLDLERAHLLIPGGLSATAGCEGDHLLAETIAIPFHDEEIVVVRDLARNEWLYAAVTPAGTSETEGLLARGIDLIRTATGNAPRLLLHPSLADLAHSQALHRRVDGLLALDQAAPESGVADALVSTRSLSDPLSPEKYAQLLGSSAREWGYFSFATLWPQFDLALDLLGALLARAAMRQFARRLMGFQNSSPEHLCRNFIEGVGTVRGRSERVEVELPRSPLLLMLQLSGLARQSYGVPWLEGREICLLPPKE